MVTVFKIRYCNGYMIAFKDVRVDRCSETIDLLTRSNGLAKNRSTKEQSVGLIKIFERLMILAQVPMSREMRISNNLNRVSVGAGCR